MSSQDPAVTASNPPPVLQPPESTALTAHDEHAAGLEFGVAQTVDEVVEAWRLVYRCYLESGLIEPNAARIHTVPHAINAPSAVVLGRINRVLVSTFSVYLDGPDGIPLDSVYPDYFADARDRGIVPVEFGLFADRREHLYRSINAMIQMMRYAVYFGTYTKVATDGYLGVHPKHVKFWTRLFGFEQVAEERAYDGLKGSPVVLLRYDWYNRIERGDRLSRGIAAIIDNPVDYAEYDRRVRLHPRTIAGTPIEQYLLAQRQRSTAV